MRKAMGCGLLVLCLSALPGRAAEVDRLLPDDAAAVICLNVRQVLEAPLLRKYGRAAAAALKNDDVAKLLAPAGFDPLHDILSVTLALSVDDAGGLLIVRGKFDRGRIAARAAEIARDSKGRIKLLELDGRPVYELAGAGKAGKAFVAVLDGETAVAAPARACIEEALAKHAGKRRGKIAPNLAKMIEDEDARQSLWAVVADAKILRRGQLAADDEVQEVLGRLVGLRLGLRINDGVGLKATLIAADAAAALALKKDLDGGLESAKAVLALLADNRPELAPLAAILDTMNLKNLGKLVLLEGSASAAVLAKAIQSGQ